MAPLLRSRPNKKRGSGVDSENHAFSMDRCGPSARRSTPWARDPNNDEIRSHGHAAGRISSKQVRYRKCDSEVQVGMFHNYRKYILASLFFGTNNKRPTEEIGRPLAGRAKVSRYAPVPVDYITQRPSRRAHRIWNSRPQSRPFGCRTAPRSRDRSAPPAPMRSGVGGLFPTRRSP